jgi:hypothetical protein
LELKTKLFYKAFRDGALTYYKKTVEKAYPDFASRNAAMLQQYNTMSIQNQNKDNMDALNITSFALERNLQPPEALQALFQYITVTAPLLPPHLRAEPHLVDFYKNAVITHRWAHSAIEKIAPGSTTLVDLHRNVVSGLSVENTTRKKTGQQPISFHDSFAPQPFQPSNAPIPTNYGGPIARYGNPPPYVQPRSKSRFGPRNSGQRNLPKSGPCFNCNGPHRIAQCQKPIDLRRSVNARLEYFRQKRNATPQDAINYLTECYYEMHDVAHELASVNLVVDDADEETTAPGADSAADEPHPENPPNTFDNYFQTSGDNLSLNNFFNAMQDESIAHARTVEGRDFDF